MMIRLDMVKIVQKDSDKSVPYKVTKDKTFHSFLVCKCHHLPHGSPTYASPNYYYYFAHGKKHRDDGPAIQHKKLCQRRHQYWIHGKRLTRKQFVQRYEMIFMKRYEGL